jgi:S1-C subfamily serine protease
MGADGSRQANVPAVEYSADMRLRFGLPGLGAVAALLGHAQVAPAPEAEKTLLRIGEATAIVLSGEGAGRLASIAAAVVVRPDGLLLTSYHGLKNAREVQVRLKSGDVFDHATLIGLDERRDVACLKITASKLAFLEAGMGRNVRPGDLAYAVTNSGSLSWSVTQGTFSELRLADEVSGAGQGYRLIQFTVATAPAAVGGALADEGGVLVGIVTRSAPSGGFAVPIESVMGLADGTLRTPLGSGSALQMPTSQPSPASRGVANADPKEMVRSAKTVAISTNSVYFTPAALERELAKQSGYGALGLMLVNDKRVADLSVTVDRPLFTYTFTYSVTDTRTSVVVQAGKVTAIDGNSAAAKIAKELVVLWAKLRQPPQTPGR